MSKTLALVLLLLAAASGARAQVLVHGVVLNTDSVPLASATVQISDATGRYRFSAVTDSSGRFSIRLPAPLPRGALDVHAEMLGYRAISNRLDVEDLQQLEIALTMDVAAIPVAPLRVEARRRYSRGRLDEFYDRATSVARMGGGIIITYQELERRTGTDVTMIVAERLPSARTCRPAYFLDGMPIEQRDLGFLSALDVEGIEIYRTMAQVPVQYQHRGACGVVLVWTPIDDRGRGTPLTWRRVFIALGVIGTLLLLMQ
jgi:hypothetical protein